MDRSRAECRADLRGPARGPRRGRAERRHCGRELKPHRLMIRPRSTFLLFLTAVAWSASATTGSAQSGPLEKARAQRAEVVPHAGGDLDATMTRRTSPRSPPAGRRLTRPSVSIWLRSDHSRSGPDRPGGVGGARSGRNRRRCQCPADLTATLEPFLGKPLSMALLADLAKALIEAWRDQDFPIVDVYFPEQNITGGRCRWSSRRPSSERSGSTTCSIPDPAISRATSASHPGIASTAAFSKPISTGSTAIRSAR